jgi:hypothetical protein
MDPMVGSGMQQAHDPRVAQAVEVVRNHEDGTCAAHGSVAPKPDREIWREDAPEGTSTEG